MDFFEMQIMIRESSLFDTKEDFKEVAVMKHEALKSSIINSMDDQIFNIFMEDLLGNISYMENNFKIKLADNIDIEFIKSVFPYNDYSKFQDFEVFFEYFYRLNLKLRDYIIGSLKFHFNKCKDILNRYFIDVVQDQKIIKDLIKEIIDEFKEEIYNKNFNSYDLEFCLKLTKTIYEKMEKLCDINISNLYLEMEHEPFHLEIFHKVNYNNNPSLNEIELQQYVEEYLKLLFNPEIFEKIIKYSS